MTISKWNAKVISDGKVDTNMRCMYYSFVPDIQLNEFKYLFYFIVILLTVNGVISTSVIIRISLFLSNRPKKGKTHKKTVLAFKPNEPNLKK